MSGTLVFAPNWVGDTIMALPVIEALAAAGRQPVALARPHLSDTAYVRVTNQRLTPDVNPDHLRIDRGDNEQAGYDLTAGAISQPQLWDKVSHPKKPSRKPSLGRVD